MSDAVVVSTARTGLAKSWRGALNMSHPVTYAGHVLRHAMERARIDPGEVEDVLDERRESFALAHDDVEVLLPFALTRYAAGLEHLAEHADQGEGGLELVAHVGHELALEGRRSSLLRGCS